MERSSLWTDEAQNRTKEREVSGTGSLKRGGGVMAQASTAATGPWSPVFIDAVTADGSSMMNSEVYKYLLSAQIQ